MNKKIIGQTAIIVGLASVVGVAATFAAQYGAPTAESNRTASFRGVHHMERSEAMVLETDAALLGLTIDELQTSLAAGQTIPELFQASGITRAQIQAAHQVAAEQRLSDAVALGQMTQQQADAITARQQEHQTEIAEHKQAMADFLGITVEQLEQAHQDGITIETLAAQAGITDDQLQAFHIEQMRSSMQAHLTQAVVDGRLTQQQADERLSHFEERVAAGEILFEHGSGGNFFEQQKKNQNVMGQHWKQHRHQKIGFDTTTDTE